MKTKIKNIILIFVAFMFCMTTMNVSAATLDSTSCDGPIYTNYYYFLDIESYMEKYSGTDVNTPYGNGFKTNYNTRATFTNNIISLDSAKSTGIAASNSLVKESGKLNILPSCNNQTNCMDLNTFYTNFKNEMGSTTGNGSFTVGNVNHMVAHTWSKGTKTGRYVDQTEEASITRFTPEQLANATLLTTTTIGGFDDSAISSAQINIDRHYEGTTVRATGDAYAPLNNVAIFDENGETVTTLSKAWLNPAVYYVKYCERAESKYLIYEPNAGTDAVTNMPSDVSFTSSTTISEMTPKRNGYTFLGWNQNSQATTPDSTFDQGKKYSGNSTKIYAIWKKNETPVSTTFKIEYDANGGTNAPDTQNGTVGECLTISETIPKQSKNKFLGWSTNDKAPEPDKDENGNLKYEPGKSTYCGGSGDLKLYAVWQPISGVESHLLVFAIVALSAGTALIVTKRKGLFKQI